MLRIQKYDPPTLERPTQWSREFNSFIAACLKKDATKRLEAAELLQVGVRVRLGRLGSDDDTAVSERLGRDPFVLTQLVTAVSPNLI